MAQKPQGGTRLQKLLNLIDGGATLDVRKAAGAQIARILVAHPAQLPAVAAQVARHLRHREWDARAAAGHCLGLLAEHFVGRTAADVAAAAGAAPPDGLAAAGAGAPAQGMLTFEGFDVARVLEQGTPLLASGGEEFEAGAPAGGGGGLAAQRAALKKRLALGGGAVDLLGGDGGDEIVADEDLAADGGGGAPPAEAERRRRGAGARGASELLADMGGMSARERAAALRKAKAAGKRGAAPPPAPAPPRKKARADPSAAPAGAAAAAAEGEDDDAAAAAAAAAEEEWQALLSGRWPFQALCDQLCVDMLHPAWEVRHGALLGLREVLRSQAGAAGVHAPAAERPGGWSAAGGRGPLALAPGAPAADAAAAAAANAAWLQDAAVHLLCVLALDRFGDFVGDQVVAPVRETAAQVLGLAARPLGGAAAAPLTRALRRLAAAPEWEARHGALLGLKYVLAAAPAVDEGLLGAALEAAAAGLGDADGDVQAAAAEALLPVAEQLAAGGAPPARRVRDLLWDALLTLEDLSPATGAVMQLLARVHAAAAGAGAAAEAGALAPRLWPFLRHPLTAVRAAAAACLASLVRALPGRVFAGAALQQAARLVFQNLLLERDEGVLCTSQEAWLLLVSTSAPAEVRAQLGQPEVLAALLRLAATPARRPLHAGSMVTAPHPRAAKGGEPHHESRVVEADGDADRTARMRAAAARALAQLGRALAAAAGGGANPVVDATVAVLRGSAATGKLVGALVVVSWVELTEEEGGAAAAAGPAVPPALLDAVAEQLSAPPAPYDEAAQLYSQMRAQAAAVAQQAAAAGARGLPAPDALASLSPAGALALAEVAPAAGRNLELAREALHSTASLLQATEAALRTTAAAGLAAAASRAYGAQPPAKLNALIQPLIAAVRREPQALLQGVAADALARLVVAVAGRSPSPADKILNNLCLFACGDPAATPSAAAPPPLDDDDDDAPRVRPKAKAAPAAAGRQADAAPEDLAAAAAALARRGGEAALAALVRAGGPGLLATLPRLWHAASAPLAAAAAADAGVADLQAAINALHVFAIVVRAVDAAAAPAVVDAAVGALPAVARCAAHPNAAVKLAAAAAVSALVGAHLEAAAPAALRALAPHLDAAAPDAARLGGVLVLERLVADLGLRLVPYVQLVAAPLLGRMSDGAGAARTAAARGFAAAVALMPLAAGVPPPPGLDARQAAALEREGGFLQQLLDARAAEDAPPPVPVAGTLRRYQQEGVNWLAFLRRFGLHGVLADDMGLGKTLQATVAMAALAHELRAGGGAAPPSLLVCPASLVAHWPYEVSKFVAADALAPLQYHGTPAERAAARRGLAAAATRGGVVVVMSYDTLRADADWVASLEWGYCVLDEGHAIAGAGSRAAAAAKRVRARHRLVLTGTPVQGGGVLELWGLFDFLMPGFLGGRRAFTARYGRAAADARGGGRAAAAAQAGLLALEGLHRRVTPFVLRRTKEQVLADLPPKTVQDVVVDPSPLQAALHADFAATPGAAAAEAAAAGGADRAAAPAVFAALLHLRRLCSHPLLALDAARPAHAAALAAAVGAAAAADPAAAAAALRADLAHAPKLAALRELLIDAGIGADPDAAAGGGGGGGDDLGDGGADAGHRVLIFAQLKPTLDLVASEVLAPLGVSHLRVDGDVDAAERFRRVQRFNGDPTVGAMLLTTGAGGLGLNLAAADTVVFLEHDWDPARDLQAMDRAHRLGQRRAVNVYRLLLRGTLEERLMSRARFEAGVAAAGAGAGAVSFAEAGSGKVLDLFSAEQEGKAAAQAAQAQAQQAAAGAAGGKAGLQAMLAELADVGAAEAQYNAEFDVEAFQKGLVPKAP